MEEMIEARVPAELVWDAWEKKLEKGLDKKLRYQVLEVKKGESFSILWKTLFVKMIFIHSVKPTEKGSQIHYKVQIKGLFSLPVRWLLGAKIKKNLSFVLKSIVRELESKRV
ncbi:MAG: hypothetical protein COT85_02170 [Chlamydiae bacterium CG10_big_fil_rev_8_21_14_0_10_42_34]|nr:MAG: hypothetical protein COT85_02170 [Chlamydiae bacterium CG10_big_fil_rev_8_21_14_0_10_42_34]